MNNEFSSPQNSPLQREIAAALESRGKRAAGIVLSIMAEPEWFQPPNGQEKVWVKWLCWNLVSKNGHNVTKPVLRFVHGELSEEALKRALDNWFPSHKSVVDNDISFS